MDAITRDLILRLRVQKAATKPLEDAAKQAKALARQQKQAEEWQAGGLKDRWRDAMRMGREINRQERLEHRRRLAELRQLKEARARAMGVVGGVARAGVGTAVVGGAIGLAAGVGLTKTLVDEARSAQNEWLGMTTLINSADSMVGGPLANVNAAFKESRVLLDQLREAAAATPGTFDDINTAFRDVVIPARRAGAEYKEIIKLASDMSTMSKVLGFDQGIVGQDVRTLLRGDSADIITPMLNDVRKEVAELARRGKGAAALKMIQQRLAVDPAIMAEFSQGFDANFATLTDEWKAFAREAGKPVLGWLTDELRAALKWLKENRDEVKKWARDLGEGVVKALKQVKEILAWIASNSEQIIGWAKWLAGAAGLAVVVTAMNAMVTALKGIIAMGPGLATALGPVMALATFLSMPIFEGKSGFEVFGYGASAMGAAATGGGRDWFFGANESTTKDAQRFMQDLSENKALEQLGEDLINMRSPSGRGRGQRTMARPGDPDFVPFEMMDAKGNLMTLAGKGAGSGFFDQVTPSSPLARVTNNIDARGARVSVNIDKVETDNPAMLARQSLMAGFTAVARQPIRARTRPGSVGLANGDQ